MFCQNQLILFLYTLNFSLVFLAFLASLQVPGEAEVLPLKNLTDFIKTPIKVQNCCRTLSYSSNSMIPMIFLEFFHLILLDEH